MNSQPQWTVLLSVVFLCGCQSLDSMIPWQSKNTPRFTAEELAALDAPKTAAGNRSNKSTQDSTSKTAQSSGIVQASYNPDSPAMPVAAERLQQLVRSGQTIVASGQTDPMKLAEARNYFEQAIALDQRHSAAHHGMAIVADLQQDYQTAEFHYKQALSANPSDPNLLNDLGYSYVLQNRFAEATNYLNRVLQVSPQHERAKVNMALMSLKRGNRAEAQQLLSGMYAPADAQATLAKLEQSLQEMQSAQMQPAMQSQPMMQTAQMQNGQMQPAMQMNNTQVQSPYNGGQLQMQSPPASSAAQDVLRRMQEERERANAATVANSPPIHVYPPGLEDKVAAYDAAQNVPQNQNMGGGMMQQPWSDQQQMMGQGQQQMPSASYPGSQAGFQQPQGQYGNQQFANPMMAQNSGTYPQNAQHNANGSLQPLNMPAQPNYQNFQTGQYQNQQPVQNYGMNAPQSPQNAPLAGLNAGPGALFPIGGSNGQPAFNGGMQSPAQGVGQPGYPQHQSMNQPQMMPGSHGFAAASVGPAGYPNQGGMQYSGNMSQVSTSRQVDSTFQNQMGPVGNQFQNSTSQYQQPMPMQAAQPFMNSAPMNSNMQGMNTSGQTGSPLEAYERQLQSLDSQYNRAIQQMDGNSLGLSSAPAQY